MNAAGIIELMNMMATILEMIKQAASEVKQAAEVIRTAQEEGRDITDEELAQFKVRLDSAIEELRRTIGGE